MSRPESYCYCDYDSLNHFMKSVEAKDPLVTLDFDRVKKLVKILTIFMSKDVELIKWITNYQEKAQLGDLPLSFWMSDLLLRDRLQ